ncbi:MAG TPA: hypothetical protein VFO94_00025 [Gammaproteobacteria bacterium]|nr:hypothetical protein [Gammaproteobacteria bacterium]
MAAVAVAIIANSHDTKTDAVDPPAVHIPSTPNCAANPKICE